MFDVRCLFFFEDFFLFQKKVERGCRHKIKIKIDFMRYNGSSSIIVCQSDNHGTSVDYYFDLMGWYHDFL